MIDHDLRKHAAEFRGYLKNHQYDVTDEGILFPKAGAFASGEYIIESTGGCREVSQNLIPDAALSYLLDVALGDTAKEPLWFLALYSGNYTPTPSLTAANFASVATEIVSATEGYTEPTRRPWEPAAAVGSGKDNYTNRAEFTMKTASSITVRGAALLSAQTKGGTSGTLISATRFANPRIEYDENIVTLGYRARVRSE